jgi:hypothetical protein
MIKYILIAIIGIGTGFIGEEIGVQFVDILRPKALLQNSILIDLLPFVFIRRRLRAHILSSISIQGYLVWHYKRK